MFFCKNLACFIDSWIYFCSDVNLSAARSALPPKEDLQRPVQELCLAVERTAQRETALFNLIVQKTVLQVEASPTPIRRQKTNNGAAAGGARGFRLSKQKLW